MREANAHGANALADRLDRRDEGDEADLLRASGETAEDSLRAEEHKEGS